MEKKKIIVRDKHSIDLEGSIDNAIETLQIYKSEGWEEIEEVYSPTEGSHYYPYKYRLETDEEYNKRIEEEEKRKNYRREMYEQLKKEFE